MKYKMQKSRLILSRQGYRLDGYCEGNEHWHTIILTPEPNIWQSSAVFFSRCCRITLTEEEKAEINLFFDTSQDDSKYRIRLHAN